jgi:hypothetical protein
MSLTALSCVTKIKLTIEHPPLVDLRNVNTITVIPSEWNERQKYSSLAGNLTRALTSGVKKTNAYRFVEPAVLKNKDKSEYGEYVDVYITGEITDVSSRDQSETKEEKDGDKTKTKKYTTRTVIVAVRYRYIRAIDDALLGDFSRTESSSVTFDDSERSSEWWIELALNIFLPKGTPSEEIAKTAIRGFSAGMERELVPWTSTEERQLEESTSKDPRFKEAEKLVNKKNYSQALTRYKNIYEETGSLIAGYNMVLLLEENKRFAEALAILEEIEKNMSESGGSPHFVKNEIRRLKEIVDGITIIMDYRAR